MVKMKSEIYWTDHCEGKVIKMVSDVCCAMFLCTPTNVDNINTGQKTQFYPNNSRRDSNVSMILFDNLQAF